ncbi:protein ALP1-like [Helicoverpa zea]|uniref:protein ALP1-like n=1 Tax=Helicoverpa zea TaxID=7113 RepID=UPI001F59016A|nr:protein ALP1-like [Helicoverpa zea]
MNNFQKEFIMGMFLDNDNASTMERLVVAVANIVSENNENMNKFSTAFEKEFDYTSVRVENPGVVPVTRRMKGFYEDSVRNFTDDDYAVRFKMKRSTVQTLINFLKNYVKPGNISLDKKVHVFLWLMVSDSSYNEIGKLFGMHKSSVSNIFHEIATLLTEHRYRFISWPSVEEQHITRIKVNSRFKFPNCVGFIDACRFKVGSKRNKKDKPEIILLQAVCDESLIFLDIHIGEIGKTRKHRVFKESALAHELKNFVEFENHILGDSEYRLRKNLITPFTSEELLTSEEMKFNEIHWKTRSYIGHAFELMKERFRKLNHIDIVKLESVHLLITVACILHNFILMHEGCSEVKEEAVACDDGVTINTSIVQTALEKRQFLCNYINYIDKEDI